MQQYTTSIETGTQPASLASLNPSQQTFAEDMYDPAYDPQNTSSIWNAKSADIAADKALLWARVPYYDSQVERMSHDRPSARDPIAPELAKYCDALSSYSRKIDKGLSDQSVLEPFRSNVSLHGKTLEELCTKVFSTSLADGQTDSLEARPIDSASASTRGSILGLSGHGSHPAMAERDGRPHFLGREIIDPLPPRYLADRLSEDIELLRQRTASTCRENTSGIDFRSSRIVLGSTKLHMNVFKEIDTAMHVYRHMSKSHLDRYVVVDREAHTNAMREARCTGWFASKTRLGLRYDCQCGSIFHIEHDEKPIEAKRGWSILQLRQVLAAAMRAERVFLDLWRRNLKTDGA